MADELGSGMRNTYKYTQLYSGKNPIFEEKDIFRTIIPLKKIATQKVGGDNVLQDVSRNVLQDVSRNVSYDKEKLIDFIKEQVRLNNKITMKVIADNLGISVKTIQRTIKEIDNLKYVGRGNNGYWKLDEDVLHYVHQDVSRNVLQNVSRNVSYNKEELIDFIKEQVKLNNKVTMKVVADNLGVSVKTIQRTIKEIDNLKYVGRGNNGYWKLDE